MAHIRKFELEALEPRVLLSGEGVLGCPTGSSLPSASHFIEETFLERQSAPGANLSQAGMADATAQIASIFDGLDGETILPVESASEHAAGEAPPADEPTRERGPSQQGNTGAETSPADVVVDRDGVDFDSESADQKDASPAVVGPGEGFMTRWLTETLRSANAPPEAACGYDDVPLLIPSGLPSIPDSLLQAIESKLNDYANGLLGGEQTFTLGDVDLGGVLQLVAPTLTFRGIQFSGTGASRVFSGTIQISTNAASLDGGAGFQATFRDGSDVDGFALAGSYVLINQSPRAGSFRFVVDRLELDVADFVSLYADGVALETSITTTGTGSTRDFRLGATGVDAFLGEGPLFQPGGATNNAARGLRISDATLGLLVRRIDANEPVLALKATGTVSLVGFAPDLALSGSNWVVVANTLGNLAASPVTIPAGSGQVVLDSSVGLSISGDATLTTPLASLSGSFGVSSRTNDNGTPDDSGDDFKEVLLGAIGVDLFIGDDQGNGPGSDDIGVRVDDATLLMLLRPDGTYALETSGDASLVNLPALDFMGSFGIQKNTTGGAVNETLTVAGVTKTLALEDGISRFGGALTLATPLGHLTGSFSVEVQSGEVIIGATGVEFFVGDDKGTPETGDDTGVKVSGGDLLLLIRPDNTYAFDAAGDASVVNVPGLDFLGSFSAQKNTTTGDVDRMLVVGTGAQQVSRRLNVAQNTSRFGGQLTLRTPVADLSGSFVVEVQSNGNGTPESEDDFNEVLFGASGVEIFLGDKQGTDPTTDDVGVRISNASVIVLLTPNNTYAFRVGGTAELVNVSDLTFGGSFFAEVNTTGGDVDRILTVGSGAGQVSLRLEVAAGVSRFGGEDVTLTTPVGALMGDFALVASGDEVLFGATDVEIFVGDDKGSSDLSDDVGVRVTGAELLLLLRRNATNTANEYAFDASGTAELVGIEVAGLAFSGTFSAQKNTTGAAVNRVLTVGAVTRQLSLADGISRFGATGVQLTVAGQTLTGDFTLEEITSPTPLVRITADNVSLILGGSPVIASVTDASGALDLAANGITGALMGDLDVNLPEVTFSTQFAIAFSSSGGNQQLAVSAAGATLTVLDQEITGDFTLERVVTTDGDQVIKVSASEVMADLGSGLVMLSDGSGQLLLTNVGVAGRVSGRVDVPVSSDFSFGTGFELAVNTTTAAVNEAFPGGALTLPAGPYVRLAANGVDVNVFGQTLTG
ncbi:MAG TPA: LEPR-XLL domain-containing protein, partial [Methylomirabilota bacterium]|nr:LEPR-XLL domain-containing protein [Methylomirabilota bacterium]